MPAADRDAAYLPESASDWYESREQHRALRTYADQAVLLPTVGRERALAENVLELLDEVERLRALVARAEYVALHLHSMIDGETWRASGGDDGQGRYEGDYHAEQVAREIRSWTK